jgi:hypothetical protein
LVGAAAEMAKPKTIYLRGVGNTETVLELKRRIVKKSGIDLHQQKLKFRNRELEDASTLASNGIRPADVVTLQVLGRTGACTCGECKRFREKLQVLVQTATGKTLTLEVTREDTVLSLKKQIQKRERIPPSRQRLLLKQQVLEDDLILNRYNLVDEEEKEEAATGTSTPITMQLIIRRPQAANVFQRLLHLCSAGRR